MKSRVTMGALGLLAVAAMGGRMMWKRTPPFERGTHTMAVEAEADPIRSDAPRLGNCPVFPFDNVWNTPIDTLPKDSRSNAYLDSIGPGGKVHPDFGSGLNYGVPYTTIDPKTRRVPVAFDYADDSDLGRYPIPPDAPIEGGPSSTGDRHIVLIDGRRCLLYELYDAHAQADGSWHAGAGVRFDLTSNALREDHKTSADAAGLAIFPGLVRYEEVQAGAINHALRFTVPHTQGAYIWPARHKASKNTDLSTPPLGIRFRLRADFDVSKYSRSNQVILKALKRYGMILADNGGTLFISGVSDKRWDDSDLHKLGAVTTEDFEAIDESELQLLPDSGRVDPLAAPR